jgi:hypothetical protein
MVVSEEKISVIRDHVVKIVGKPPFEYIVRVKDLWTGNGGYTRYRIDFIRNDIRKLIVQSYFAHIKIVDDVIDFEYCNPEMKREYYYYDN